MTEVASGEWVISNGGPNTLISVGSAIMQTTSILVRITVFPDAGSPVFPDHNSSAILNQGQTGLIAPSPNGELLLRTIPTSDSKGTFTIFAAK